MKYYITKQGVKYGAWINDRKDLIQLGITQEEAMRKALKKALKECK